eukprot:gene952-1847_t
MADPLKEMFEKSKDRLKEEINLTPEETDKFKNAFDDPEFRKLLGEYMDDLNDSKFREENEAYISQLEGDKQVPQGKELIRPSAAFVAKSHKLIDGKESDKLFINIVHSDKILVPSKVDTDKGQHWSIPYSLGPPHMEKDKSGFNVAAFDCCFHPEAIRLGKLRKEFHDMLVQTAMDGVEAAYKKQGQKITVKREYHIVKGITYKSGVIPTMMVDTSTKTRWEEKNTSDSSTSSSKSEDKPVVSEIDSGTKEKLSSTSPSTSTSTSSSLSPSSAKNVKIPIPTPSSSSSIPQVPIPTPSSSSSIPSTSMASDRDPLIKKGFLNSNRAVASSKVLPPRNHSESSSTATTTTSTTGSTSSESPLKKRGSVSMGDFERLRSSKVISNRPAELIYRFEVPLAAKSSLLALDVAEKSLKLSYTDIYHVSIQLPYPVDEKKGSAKYDKSSKSLTVTLSVKPHIHDNDHNNDLPLVEEDITTTANNNNDVIEEDTTSSSSTTITTSNTKNSSKDKDIHNRWDMNVDVDLSPSPSSSMSLSERIKVGAAEALRNAEANMNKTNKNDNGNNNNGNDGSEEKSNYSDFIPSHKFMGGKSGYVFKTDKRGLGYYIDTTTTTMTSPLLPSLGSEAGSGTKLSKQLNKEDKNNIQNSTIIKDEIKPNINEIRFKIFPYEYRQTTKSIAILVQVPSIIGDSVKINFNIRDVDIQFITQEPVEAEVKLEVEAGDKAYTNVSYAMGIELQDDINVSTCRYDVATKNMVVLLVKAKESYWMEENGIPILRTRPYRKDTVIKKE